MCEIALLRERVIYCEMKKNYFCFSGSIYERFRSQSCVYVEQQTLSHASTLEPFSNNSLVDGSFLIFLSASAGPGERYTQEASSREMEAGGSGRASVQQFGLGQGQATNAQVQQVRIFV